MPLSIDQALAACIEAVERGIAVEECLAIYPEFAPELEPILRLVERAHRANRAAMSDEAFARGRAKVVHAAQQAHTARRARPKPIGTSTGAHLGPGAGRRVWTRPRVVAKPSDYRPDAPRAFDVPGAPHMPAPRAIRRSMAGSGHFPWPGAVGASVAACLVVGAIWFGLVVGNSLPGSPFYTLKRNSEQVQTALVTTLARSDGSRAAWLARQTERRLNELATLETENLPVEAAWLQEVESQAAATLAAGQELSFEAQVLFLDEWLLTLRTLEATLEQSVAQVPGALPTTQAMLRAATGDIEQVLIQADLVVLAATPLPATPVDPAAGSAGGDEPADALATDEPAQVALANTEASPSAPGDSSETDLPATGLAESGGQISPSPTRMPLIENTASATAPTAAVQDSPGQTPPAQAGPQTGQQSGQSSTRPTTGSAPTIIATTQPGSVPPLVGSTQPLPTPSPTWTVAPLPNGRQTATPSAIALAESYRDTTADNALAAPGELATRAPLTDADRDDATDEATESDGTSVIGSPVFSVGGTITSTATSTGTSTVASPVTPTATATVTPTVTSTVTSTVTPTIGTPVEATTTPMPNAVPATPQTDTAPPTATLFVETVPEPGTVDSAPENPDTGDVDGGSQLDDESEPGAENGAPEEVDATPTLIPTYTPAAPVAATATPTAMPTATPTPAPATPTPEPTATATPTIASDSAGDETQSRVGDTQDETGAPADRTTPVAENTED